ncbi:MULTISPECIES: hypothetical protein [Ponticoccus]|uniref:Uncharacterized protein n=1 Tax=Ponticoccus litoralis TaxID=422297 RepID=A0AAW9SRB8_9RHOB
MLLRLKRTQTTAIGRLQAATPYAFDMKDSRHAAVANALLKRGMAEKLTKADLDVAGADPAALQRAMQAATSDGRGIAPALAERAAILEQEVAERLARNDAAKAKAPAAGKADKA